ncbi:DNA repair protein RecN [Pseudoteredinibacter isoporae]|uniref:DNA repair protein RecN n=1 Tax=Pseudoteredinibacter isoporae TaxID=570281 RepID=A0A7X0MWQ1_9GAMM|nr:DNA repair protein RecN [Pseudoteredinibacter isoporae]MBB6521194.1 DNA repair protein RecN (Recombination protein N) [Pseudoteredinibacter isoporae]NHO86754.1 DNA repair protein RecN [Pseudoteredinibacter isoporae]NIB24794.1 DNA repair protein RecN [Pseudoteredinibacter isoporae]
MLTQLSINNITLVDSLDLELDQGLTAITGETGAGKSILLNALGLAIGERADADKVRKGASKADVYANFDISQLPAAQKWLQRHELDSGSSEGALDEECLLRRVLSAEGRSRAYINGNPVTLQQLKGLGELLIDIHGQHEHQSLLKKEHHRRLLDNFGSLKPLLEKLKQAFKDYRLSQQRFIERRDNAEEISARHQLLSYQVSELDELDLNEDELEKLEQEQQQLANAEDTLHKCQQVANLCEGESEFSLRQGLNQCLQLLSEINGKSTSLSEAENMLGQALIQLEEANGEIQRHVDGFEADPERLHELENRLSRIYDIARKHRIDPSELSELHQQLSEELASLGNVDEDLDQLQQQSEAALKHYKELAAKLRQKRQAAAKKLQAQVNKQLENLAMSNAFFEIALRPIDEPSSKGSEEIEFLIATNPGQDPKPLGKIASGGELSRISLAIQVVTAQTSAAATLVFDEVDVGIGGATANVVGQMLRQLGERCQVLCVTHLPQVASKAHQHLQVSKTTDKAGAASSLSKLEDDERISEIARMLGGEASSEQAVAHAKEMLSTVH